jgi:HSP20 family protein
MAKQREDERRQDREEQGRRAEPGSPSQQMAGTEQGRGHAGVPARRERQGLARPWSLRQMFDEFDRMFEDMQQQMFGRGFLARPWAAGMADWAPRMDVEDRGQEVVLTVELPGFSPDEVDIDCTDDILTIRGEHRESEEEEGYRAERSFHRELAVPAGCDTEKIEASFRNGLLRIRLPRVEQQRGRRIPISSEQDTGEMGGERAA